MHKKLDEEMFRPNEQRFKFQNNLSQEVHQRQKIQLCVSKTSFKIPVCGVVKIILFILPMNE